MMGNEAVREMTFDEEYQILQAESCKLFEKEKEGSDPPLANCVVRRALRCIAKLSNEMREYRELGTVQELSEIVDDYAVAMTKWRQYEELGTVDELREAISKSNTCNQIEGKVQNDRE